MLSDSSGPPESVTFINAQTAALFSFHPPSFHYSVGPPSSKLVLFFALSPIKTRPLRSHNLAEVNRPPLHSRPTDISHPQSLGDIQSTQWSHAWRLQHLAENVSLKCPS